MHIQEVILQTASLQKTKQFYTKTLELPIVNQTDKSITFGAGNSLLTFTTVTESKPFYHIAFNVTNNRFSDCFEWLNSKVDIIKTELDLPIAVYEDWNAESFYCYDNNGSILEFIVRFDLPYYSPGPFSVADIKEISEVGIVATDVTETAAKLQSTFNAPTFAKSKPNENFAVLGDDAGLLIITSAGRPWIPANKPALLFPITITADGVTIEL